MSNREERSRGKETTRTLQPLASNEVLTAKDKASIPPLGVRHGVTRRRSDWGIDLVIARGQRVLMLKDLDNDQ